MKQEKLVRDKIFDFSQEKQDGRTFRIADSSEMSHLLAKKLQEESLEVEAEICAPRQNRERLIEELADLHEVWQTLLEWEGITMGELFEAQAAKTIRKGRFRERLVLCQADQMVCPVHGYVGVTEADEVGKRHCLKCTGEATQ